MKNIDNYGAYDISMIDIETRTPRYMYKIFGLNAASDIMLPQLVETEGEPDIYIVRGKVSEEIESAIVKGEYIQVSESELLYTVRGVGRYHVSSGRYVVVEPFSECSEQLVQLYLLGSAMGAVLLQKGILPIHGSAVVIQDKAFVITGCSGAGKSSLTLALREMGCKFLTDDIAALTQDKDGTIYVQPSYPQQKLWKDSIEAIGDDVEALTQISSSKEKYYYPVLQGFCDHPVRLGAVCELVPCDDDVTELRAVNGVEKVDVLMRNIYRYQFACYFGKGQAYFRKCADIAGSVKTFRLLRPFGRFTAGEQAELLITEAAI